MQKQQQQYTHLSKLSKVKQSRNHKFEPSNNEPHSGSPSSETKNKLRNVQATVLHFMSTELVGDLFSSLVSRQAKPAVKRFVVFKLCAFCFQFQQYKKFQTKKLANKEEKCQESQRKMSTWGQTWIRKKTNRLLSFSFSGGRVGEWQLENHGWLESMTPVAKCEA